MRRRTLLHQLPACLAAPALAQAPAGAQLLVLLTSFARPAYAEAEAAIRQELARLGWRIGETLRLEIRYAENRPDQLDAMARELVALQPAAALATDDSALRALMRYTTQVPLVIAYASDPVAGGVAASLRRPGGQVTGMTWQWADIRPKLYELARLVAPMARRAAGLFDQRLYDERGAAIGRELAQRVGLDYASLPVREAGEIEAALRSLTPAHEHVLLVSIDELMFANFRATASLARTLRLASGSLHPLYARSGGLFSYGPVLRAMTLRAVQMASQVLHGQNVGEIPFEQPSRFVFTLNRSTAKAVGLALSPELLLRADEVIE